MMNLFRWQSLLLATALLFSATLFAAQNPAAKSLIAHFKNIDSISTSFTQTVINRQANSKEQTTGRIILQGRKLFRLEYLTPYKQVYVADGKLMWFYDEDLEQVTVKHQQEDLNNTPAMILSQPENFIQQYQVSMLEENGTELYTLFTRTEQSAFDKINLRFSGDKLVEMIMYDSFGSETRLKFTSIKYNIKPAPSTFMFQPPKGVDIIQQYPDPDPDETE